ncbi:L7Ae/L30e/S12e/Gadd45 family ribosomal protein [Anaerorhabdus furcosa]|uniref:Ribosomal protein L7Ae n=1 Tax=Anaerorhabdus furcosa TaxID=118967 RepID=A0A1T4Q145_9FIRM|nr:ribosomal L7Ae/L30e/S12e/Gadd45 family protein [Anaerorhabdus furcosa]SJZ97502.1 Ribosomal protein L7Ae [Anaerorhabdus furcosa]
MDSKIAGYLGLANRARKVVIGDSAIKAIQKKDAKLVLLADDCSLNTQKKVLDKCNFYQVEVVRSMRSIDLAYAIGRAEISFVAICDDGFAKAILNCLK